MEFSDGTSMHVSAENSPLRKVYGTTGDDILSGIYVGSCVYGQEGNDKIYCGDGADKLYGHDGADYLDGGSGDDILDGGTGMDVLKGSDGDDVYLLYKGCGNDTIFDANGSNTLRFTDDTIPEDISLSKTGELDVQIEIVGSTDTIILQYFREYESRRNYTLEFLDGRTATFDVANLLLIYESK